MASSSIPFHPSTDIPSLSNKAILITGANTGLGKAAALELAQHRPAHVWLAARDASRGQAAVADVQKHASSETSVSLLHLDLSSFASIKAAAKTILTSAERLDILMLNAGILGCPPAVSEDGYEMQFATNHLGHALLLKLLLPLLIKTAATGADVRVVSVASVGYKFSTAKTIQLDTLKTPSQILDVTFVSPTERYCQSKLANLLYAQEVAKRYPQLRTVSLDPGAVLTDLFRREPGDEQVKMVQTVLAPQHGGPVEDGVKNQLWAATAREGVESGKFYEPVGRGGLEEGPALDGELAARLWEWTEKELERQEV